MEYCSILLPAFWSEHCYNLFGVYNSMLPAYPLHRQSFELDKFSTHKYSKYANKYHDIAAYVVRRGTNLIVRNSLLQVFFKSDQRFRV